MERKKVVGAAPRGRPIINNELGQPHRVAPTSLNHCGTLPLTYLFEVGQRTFTIIEVFFRV